MPKYLIDTNVYITAQRDRELNAELVTFSNANAAHLYLSAVVLHELLVGVSNPTHVEAMDRALIAPFRRASRIIGTSDAVWKGAAAMVNQLRFERTGSEERLKWANFRHDILIAATCRSVGATLITFNAKDFDVINDVNGFHYVAPFP